MQPVISLFNAWVYTVLSIFGALILSVFGWGFAHNWEALMGSTHDPEDGRGVAEVCYWAAIGYVAVGVFCVSQVLLHRRKAGEIRL